MKFTAGFIAGAVGATAFLVVSLGRSVRAGNLVFVSPEQKKRLAEVQRIFQGLRENMREAQVAPHFRA